MTIIKNRRFSKICKCGATFIPKGKYQKLCENCHPQTISLLIAEAVKTQRRVNRKDKMEKRLKSLE